MNKVLHGDCMEHLAKLKDNSVQLGFTDPPYNIGYKYDDYNDNMPTDEYLWWCEGWIREYKRILTQTGAFWIVIGDEFVSELDVLAKRIGFTKQSHVVWYYTFGVNCKKRLSRSHTHLLYYVCNAKKYTCNCSAIGIPSARQTVYKDKRAAGLRMPDNTWILRPQDLPDGFLPSDDTWHIPRVCGTYKERVAGSSNQLPELLCQRVIELCSNPGDTVLDTFGGTGTIAVVAQRLKRQYITIEQSEKWVSEIKKRLSA